VTWRPGAATIAPTNGQVQRDQRDQRIYGEGEGELGISVGPEDGFAEFYAALADSGESETVAGAAAARSAAVGDGVSPEAAGPEPEVAEASTDVPVLATDPSRLARQIKAKRAGFFWKGAFWSYTGTHYEEMPAGELEAEVFAQIKEIFDQDYRDGLADRQARGLTGQADYEKFVTEMCRRHNLVPRKRGHHVAKEVSTHLVSQAIAALAAGKGTLSHRTPLFGQISDNRQPNLLAVQGGLLDLGPMLEAAEKGQTPLPLPVKPHTPDWFSPVCLPYDYDPAAPRPRRFLEALDLSLEKDAGRIALLQEWFGYHLLRGTDAQAFMVLYGKGGNGKGMIAAALTAMLGGRRNVSNVSLRSFADKFSLHSTYGKAANISLESEKTSQVAEDILKGYTAGDPVKFERKGKDAIWDLPTAKLTLATNTLPYFTDKSEGVWRRYLVLPLFYKIPHDQKVTRMYLAEYWAESGELPGILNWALEGLVRLARRKFDFALPPVCEAVKDEHRLSCDHEREWLEMHFAYGPGAPPLSTTKVYEAYREWMRANGYYPVGAWKFSAAVRRVFPQLTRPSRKTLPGGKKTPTAWHDLAVREQAT
jgi:P4 family phage/plasmid primase-like protien